MISKVLPVLQKARAIIQAGWCQRSFALDAKGNPCSQLDEQAVSFCALGAIGVAAYRVGGSAMTTLSVLHRVIEKEYGGPDNSVMSFNDRHTKEQVLALFDKAIALEQGH